MEKKTEKIAEEKLEKQELKDEEADQVAGGATFARVRCPQCGGFLFGGEGRNMCSCGRSN